MATTPYPFVAGAVLTASQLNSTFNVPINAQTASYVLLASDAGKRVQMNAAGSTSITVNTSLFQAGDNLFIQNIGAGTCTITAGTATVTTAGSLALAQWGGGTLYFTSASAAIFFSGAGSGYGVASGGTGALATPPAGYSGIFFNSSLTLTVSKSGIFDVMAFGGGAGGGYGNGSNQCGAGGGAGQYSEQSIYLAAGSYSVIIGAGGTSVSEQVATSGSGTTIGTTVGNFAVCGGGGAGIAAATGPTIGGSGGGAARSGTGAASAAAATGFAGGNASGSTQNGAGGGGAGSVGSNSSGTTGAAGGTGKDIATFTGNASTFKAGGGGGGGSAAGGAGGSSFGGAGGTTTGTAAAANTASGGGGGANGAGGNGGSGVLYIRWKV